jgi:hypothetical protein
MAKLTLTASPTFPATVKIPVPGAKPAPVEFKFNGMTKTAYKEWFEKLSTTEDVDAVMQVASGWDMAEPFNKESVEKFLDQYIGAAKAILEKFIGELTGAQLGN